MADSKSNRQLKFNLNKSEVQECWLWYRKDTTDDNKNPLQVTDVSGVIPAVVLVDSDGHLVNHDDCPGYIFLAVKADSTNAHPHWKDEAHESGTILSVGEHGEFDIRLRHVKSRQWRATFDAVAESSAPFNPSKERLEARKAGEKQKKAVQSIGSSARKAAKDNPDATRAALLAALAELDLLKTEAS